MDPIRNFFRKAIDYIARKILLYNLGVCVIVALTFIYTRDLNVNNYSDRMVWAAMIIIVVGGVVVLGVSAVASDFGVPPLITKPEQAKKYVAHQGEIQQRKEKRYDVAIQLFVIGLMCVAIAAVLQVVFGKS